MLKKVAMHFIKESTNVLRDDVRTFYAFWIVHKVNRLTKVLKSSFAYYSKKMNDNRDKLQHIRAMILRHQLWEDRICAYCGRYGKAKLCCGCYSVWYCNQKCQN